MTDRSISERLRQIRDHDWRISFLAHTSDTAGEAAAEIDLLKAELADHEDRANNAEAREALERVRAEKAEAALRPFSALGSAWTAGEGCSAHSVMAEAQDTTVLHVIAEKIWSSRITLGDLRRARAVLAEPQEPK